MKKHLIIDYINLLREHNLLIETKNINDKVVIENVSYNSKKVTNNTLFVCKGITYKKEYLDEAINNGAIIYVCEEDNKTRDDIPYILVSDIRKSLSLISQIYYDFPSKKN